MMMNKRKTHRIITCIKPIRNKIIIFNYVLLRNTTAIEIIDIPTDSIIGRKTSG